MKILLINPIIRENEPPRHVPIGLGIIANILLNEGHDVKILDINAERLSKSQVKDKINLKSKYDIIGTGGLITTYKYLKWLIPELKKCNPDSKIVIGGGVVTATPTLLLSRTPADIAVVGEGEITMKELVFALKNDKSLDAVDGIAYKKGGDIKLNKRRALIKDLDSLPFPAYDLFPIDIYLHNVAHAHIIGRKTEMTLMTSRDCPYNCNYCFHLTGRGVRVRSIDNVIEEIKLVKHKYKTESIAFCDDTFTISKKRVMEFCRKMISEKTDIPWDCYARVNLVDREMLVAMKKAGCYRVGYGIESGSQEILNNMNKEVTVEQAKKAIKLTRSVGLYCGTTFMFGYLGETFETIRETTDFCRELSISPSFFFTTSYPGTKLYEQVKGKIIKKYRSEERFIEVLGDADKFTINLTNFSDKQLLKLKKEVESFLRTKRFHPKSIFTSCQQFGLSYFIKLLLTKLRSRVR